MPLVPVRPPVDDPNNINSSLWTISHGFDGSTYDAWVIGIIWVNHQCSDCETRNQRRSAGRHKYDTARSL
ncbi:unnamed protein product [Cylicostephanus goldi]|uniref:Uncharacterized protein n=1 Tax=Cylicostephanus goldi TaxID=71465 RepID=A0A3P6UCA1_CYLGO|nr:unnamed protein product [Cylicostephanus goldi]